MLRFLNRNYSLFSAKTGIFLAIIALVALFAEWIIYAAGGMSPVVWSGECSVAAHKDRAYAVCQTSQGEIKDSINAVTLYKVAADHRKLLCDMDTYKNLYCKLEDTN